MSAFARYIARLLSRSASASAVPPQQPASRRECDDLVDETRSAPPDLSQYRDVPPPLPDSGVECPACSETMIDTGRTEPGDGGTTAGRLMSCPACGNRSLWCRSLGRSRAERDPAG